MALSMLRSFVSIKKDLEKNIEILKILNNVSRINLRVAVGSLSARIILRIEELANIFRMDE